MSVHAGAGGTDAQDWTEMLLRMYLRCAEDRGFQTDLVEAIPAEPSGLKTATVMLKGENAYGSLRRPSSACTGSSACRPFDQRARRHTSFARVDRVAAA